MAAAHRDVGDNPPTTQPPVWHILGAGAMGCLWAARIRQTHGQGSACLLLRDAEALDHYRSGGGIVLEQAGQTTLCDLEATAVSQLQAPVHHLLVTTKAQDAQTALESVKHVLTPESVIILLQNGVRQLALAAALTQKQVYCLSTSHGAYLTERFHVVHAGAGGAWLGAAGPEARPCSALLPLLPAAMQVRCDSDIRRRIWLKFAVNCAANALTVVHDCRNGELLTRPAARAQLRALCAEIELIFAGLPDVPKVDLMPEVEQVLQATALNFSSTLQDVRRGRPTEISELNGYLCEMADQHSLPCELNRALVSLLS